MKKFCKRAALPAVAVLLAAILLGAQGIGYRYAGNGQIFAGLGSGIFTEPTYNAGSDIGLARLGTGQLGAVNGGLNVNPNAVITPPPVVSLSNAGTGGTIAAGTYRGVLTYRTPTGGRTVVAAAGEATTTTSGSTSTITFTAPIAAAGAEGYEIWLSAAAGATLTETLQPMTTTVCSTAFVDPTGVTVCPFGTNSTITSVATGAAVPLQNSAAFPAAVPQLICNLIAQPANTTITTAQTMGSCILGAGIQNVSGKVLRVTGHLVYTSATQTGTMTIAVTEGGITPMTVTSTAITAGGQTNAQAEFDYYLTTAFTGTAGTLEGHGHLCAQLATAANGTALPCWNDQITAVSSAINLTASNTLAITIAMSSSTTSATLRDAQVWLLN
jgi:hypothetical protein